MNLFSTLVLSKIGEVLLPPRASPLATCSSSHLCISSTEHSNASSGCWIVMFYSIPVTDIIMFPVCEIMRSTTWN